MNSTVTKSEIRKGVREVIELHEMNLITEEYLREFAEMALLLELTMSLERKSEIKHEKFQRYLNQTK